MDTYGDLQRCVCVCVCVWGQPLFPRDSRLAQFFSLKAGGAAAHPVLHQRRHWMSAGDM